MTIQERVQEIFNRFNVDLAVSEEAPRTDMAEATLENGTVIYTDADEFGEGAEAYIINDEGEQIKLPPGDYTLKDGGSISVADGGKVAKVVKPGAGKDGAEGKGKGQGPVKSTPKDDGGGDAGGDAGGSGGGKGKPAKKGKGKLAAEELEEGIEEEVIEEKVFVTRDEVEGMIAAALEDAMKPKDEEMGEKKDDEEMVHTPDHEAKDEYSAVNPEAAKGVDAAEAPAEEPAIEMEIEVELEEEQSPEATELAAVKAELAEMKKKAAEPGLKHAAPSTPKAPLKLENLSTEERVRAIQNHFNA